jgi:hypothetical protein
MALPGIVRGLLIVLACAAALHLVGFVLLQVGGSSPAERGRGSPVELVPPR